MNYFQFVQETIRALLNYFRFGSSTEKTAEAASDPPVDAGSETESIKIEELIVTSRAVKRPPRPPVQGGRGGQTHSTQ